MRTKVREIRNSADCLKGSLIFHVLAIALIIRGPLLAANTSTNDDTNGPLVLVADWMVQPDGTLRKDVAVVIADGKIQQVSPAADFEDQEVHRLPPGSVLSPGMIDVCASMGAYGQTTETTQLVDPEAAAADAIDPLHHDLSTALRAGITAALVVPQPNNLVNGTGVCFRTWADGGQLDVLRDKGPLVFALGDGVWQRERAPTSRAGALLELRQLVAKAQAAKAHPRINAALDGSQNALIFCPSLQDVTAARDALGDTFLDFVVVHSEDALDLAADATAARRPIVVGPYSFTSQRRVLLGAAALANSGAEIAFRGGFPQSPPEGLRITAALAVRHGMQPAVARRAITVVPAKVAGVADRIGEIAAGKDADLVVFSADPLRLDAAVREVFIKGVRVVNASSRNHSSGGDG